jgi:hypothetical protein
LPSVWEGGARKQRRMNTYKDILNIKLERDLKQKCKEYAEAQGITLDEDWLKDKITEKTKDVDWVFGDEKQPFNRHKCCARVWGDCRGTQCDRKKVKGEFCLQHDDMMLRYGVLRFGDYRVDVSKKNPYKAKDFIKKKYGGYDVEWNWRRPVGDQLQYILNQQQLKIIYACREGSGLLC